MLKKMFFSLAIMLLMSSCAGIFGRPKTSIVVNDDVQVCFRQSEAGHTLVTIRPQTCYSMRCTKLLLASGTGLLDRREFTLNFETTFHFYETKPFLLPCTDDCAGGGMLNFDLGVLDVGLYGVDVWDGNLGDLSVTSGLPWQDQCLP